MKPQSSVHNKFGVCVRVCVCVGKGEGSYGSLTEKKMLREFPGCPVVRTPSFHCREHGFNPWSGN